MKKSTNKLTLPIFNIFIKGENVDDVGQILTDDKSKLTTTLSLNKLTGISDKEAKFTFDNMFLFGNIKPTGNVNKEGMFNSSILSQFKNIVLSEVHKDDNTILSSNGKLTDIKFVQLLNIWVPSDI